MSITPLPPLDRTSATFKTDADTFFGSQLPAFSVQAEAARLEINAAAAATGGDSEQTGLDRVQTGADRTQTGLDRTAASDSAGGALSSKNAADAIASAFGDVQGAIDAATAQAALATTNGAAQLALAVAQVGLALDGATASEVSNLASGVAAAAAAAAKSAAELAQAAAWSASRTYANTAAGVAATTTGQYFTVPVAASDDLFILYLNNAGVAVEQGRGPSSAFTTKTVGRNLVVLSDAIVGQQLNASTGLPSANAAESYSPIYHPVTPGSFVSSRNISRIAEYDAAFVVVPTSGATTPTHNVLRLKATTAYIRVGWVNTNNATAQCSVGKMDGGAPYVAGVRKREVTNLKIDPAVIQDAVRDAFGQTSALVLTEQSLSPIIGRVSSINLFDNRKTIAGHDIGTTGFLTVVGTASTSDYIPVTSGQTVYFYAPGGILHTAFYDANSDFISRTASVASAVAPADGFVRLAILTTKLPVAAVSIGTAVTRTTPFHRYLMASNVLAALPVYDNLVWHAMGDSITADVAAYHVGLAASMGFNTVNNHGIGGAAMARRPTVEAGTPALVGTAACIRVSSLPLGADLVTDMSGTNDWQQTPLGVMADRVDTTFYGACHLWCIAALARFPTARIALFTPPPRTTQANPAPLDGNVLARYAAAKMEVAAYYNIPALDLLSASRLHPLEAANAAAYYTDGLHPNAAGHIVLAAQIKQFLERLG